MLHQPRVLVVDDDENIISAFDEFLKKEHCAMISASNAEDALAVIAHQLLNLVITDVRMKWHSGVTLLMKIKQTHPTVPVIVITGHPNLIREGDIKHLGAEYVFVKPLELDQLRVAVRSCLVRSASSTQRHPSHL